MRASKIGTRTAGPQWVVVPFALGVTLLPLIVVAAAVWPDLEDTYLFLLLKEYGVSRIAAAHTDRPLIGLLWESLARLCGRWFWETSLVLHAIVWLGLGAVAVALWRSLFPDWSRFGPLVGCLIVAPIVVQ